MSSSGENTDTTCGTSNAAHTSTPAVTCGNVNPIENVMSLSRPPLPRASKRVSSSTTTRKNVSDVWDHFTKNDCENKDKMTSSCNYCGSVLGCASKSGTTVLRNHIHRCPKYPFNLVDKKQRILVFQQHSSDLSTTLAPTSSSTSPSLVTWKFDQELIRQAVAKMIIIDELPFSHVENEGYRYMMNVAQPRFQVPSRTTIARDCLNIYVDERQKLNFFFCKYSHSVCLTTDTWTSCQNLNYMCLTAHFIDDDWKMNKKILNFCPITSHKGLNIGKSIERCLIDWGISKVLTVTVDNASSNDVGIAYLKQRLQRWKGSVLNGNFIHMRCCAHLLSLTIKEGLKEMDDSIFRIRSAVRYVRSSPARLNRFKECVEQEKIESKSLLVLDVETRWNSTYLMLDVALKFQKAFDLLEIQDSKYKEELTSGERSRGLPTSTDWDYARYLLPFLKVFYDATLHVSGSLYVTANTYMSEIYGIGLKILAWCKSNDHGLRSMATRMRGKHEKYWANVNNINIMLFIAVVLDPSKKLRYVYWAIDKSYDDVNAGKLKTKVHDVLFALFEEYSLVKCSSNAQSSDQSRLARNIDYTDANVAPQVSMNAMYKEQMAGQHGFEPKSELEKYLQEQCEDDEDENFDILTWWKLNSARYQILSLITRDVLAIPASTVASESAFSTGGRILDPFRSSLTPKSVEALICTQDWIRATCAPFVNEESLDELSEIESEITSLTIENSRVHLDDC